MENSNFIKTIIAKDIETGKHDEIITRFPPEPNGFLHIGHAKAIVTNFELAKQFNGKTNLRFDDTNPVKEDTKYVEAIKNDVLWLGYQWDALKFASDYFDEFYNRAIILIKKGLAYVCDLSPEEMTEYKGDSYSPGKNSPYRDRTVEENLSLFEKMKNGEYENGKKVLRAKIDMAHGNMNMRDPVIYRINHVSHHNTGDKWCIYPMYDFAHPLEDAIEGITHSLCSLEFEEHRPLYDWFVEQTEMPLVPRQIEFGRLAVDNTITSKRYLLKMVEEGIVDGWDDPRMPTISGLRRRGFTKEAIREFCLETGLSKVNSSVSIDFLEHFVRQDLSVKAETRMAVLNPLKVVITNLDNNHLEYLEAENHPKEDLGVRHIPFTKEIYIEKDDFIEEKPNKKWKRLALGEEVRLRNAYFIKANDVVKDSNGNIVEIHCTYDINTKSGSGFDDRKPNGTIHWVSATKCVDANINLFEPLFSDNVSKDNFLESVNINSKITVKAVLEESLKSVAPETKFQFIRNGYFVVDRYSKDGELEFNRVVELKSSVKK